MQDPDGGEDKVGGNLRVGVDGMKMCADAVYSRGGAPEDWDDTSAVFLGPAEIKEARAEEMRFFDKLGVYASMPRSKLRELGAKMVSAPNGSALVRGTRLTKNTNVVSLPGRQTLALTTRCTRPPLLLKLFG